MFCGFLAELPTGGNMTPRRPTSWLLAFCALLVGSTAWALPPGYREGIEHDIGPPTPPAQGRERAQLRGIPWCGGVRERDKDWGGLVIDDLQQYRQNRHSQFRLFHLARAVCSEPEEPLAQRIATEVLQLWINETGMTARDAVDSLALHADKDTFQAERTALCDAIQPKGDDTRKERNALAAARFLLLGCKREDPLWMFPDEVEHLGPFIDRGSAARDDLAHLAWVLHRQFKDLEEGVDDALIGYAIDQFDFHAVSADAVLHQLDAAPLRGSRYARVMVLESLGHAQVMTAKIEALVAKRASDPEWKEMLITAPDRGSAAWNAAAERDKAALARSDEFDRKLREGGDIHGCQAALRPDFLAMWKKFKHEDIPTLEAAMSDHPLAGLLAKRGQLEEAEKLMLAARDELEKSLGKDSADARSAVDAVVSEGLGMFLRRVDIDDQPVFVGGKFHGFRIAGLRDPQFWNGVDLKPGDVVTSVNGFPIEHPEQAQTAFESLEVASELRVVVEREGHPRELVYPIVDDR